MTKRILSGMQPTSHLHLGNYLGALKNWVGLQDEGECLYMVADLHAITMPYDQDTLKQATREIAAAYIAAGVDPDKASLFVQSSVAEHSQLMWLLATMSQMGKLERMTQFKDKAGKDAERAGLGLFSYPVLMAADVLLYQATDVPVGDDQKQHLELARDIASTFNHRYDTEFFTLPEPMIKGGATRVMSLRDGTQKMSKSAESDMSRINLTDDADLIVKKFKKAKTDPHPVPDSIDNMNERPEAKNLITIYAALADRSAEQVIAEFGGKGFGDFKKALAELSIATLAPITERMNALLANPAEIDAILEKGNARAREIAGPVLKDAMKIMGFWQK
ncbi:MAG: tryptophan--tRNA ligase [Alphaproteobacteria bacterium]|jgi:tryptophanyl-tRNA synthetase|nr:tryptophan--tRNA ligase [Alphaproteobacteria bacterium]MDP7222873.1 tryptophan--tRNA ligase [Alphaproteobacteria bacterium]